MIRGWRTASTKTLCRKCESISEKTVRLTFFAICNFKAWSLTYTNTMIHIRARVVRLFVFIAKRLKSPIFSPGPPSSNKNSWGSTIAFSRQLASTGHFRGHSRTPQTSENQARSPTDSTSYLKSFHSDSQIDNGFFNWPIIARTQILVNRWGPEQGFRRCFADELNNKV